MRQKSYYYVFFLVLAVTELFGSCTFAFFMPLSAPPTRRVYSTSRNHHFTLGASTNKESEDKAAISTTTIAADHDLTADQVG